MVSRVTAPLRGSNRPLKVALVCAVIDVYARTSATKLVPVLNVAELPTCQTTRQGSAPLSSRTRLFDSAMRVDPARKMNWASLRPCASRVSVPVCPSVGEV